MSPYDEYSTFCGNLVRFVSKEKISGFKTVQLFLPELVHFLLHLLHLRVEPRPEGKLLLSTFKFN